MSAIRARAGAYVTTEEMPPARPGEPTSEKAAVAMRAFFRAMDAWRVSPEEARVLLGRPGRATYFNWKRGQVRKVPHDTLRRISYVLGIWKALQVLFAEPARADAWVQRPNELFAGQSALGRMLGGDVTDLAAVRATLDAVRGGGL